MQQAKPVCLVRVVEAYDLPIVAPHIQAPTLCPTYVL